METSIPSAGMKEGCKCVKISGDKRNWHGSIKRVLIAREYVLEPVPKRAKQPHTAIGRNRDFCDSDPLDTSGRKLCRTSSDGVKKLRLYQQSKPIQDLNQCSPVARVATGLIPTPPTREERVPGTALGDPKRVSHPRCMLVWYIPMRAKPPVNCVAPNREAKG